jgi:hypothetical protein
MSDGALDSLASRGSTKWLACWLAVLACTPQSSRPRTSCLLSRLVSSLPHDMSIILPSQHTPLTLLVNQIVKVHRVLLRKQLHLRCWRTHIKQHLPCTRQSAWAGGIDRVSIHLTSRHSTSLSLSHTHTHTHNTHTPPIHLARPPPACQPVPPRWRPDRGPWRYRPVVDR